MTAAERIADQFNFDESILAEDIIRMFPDRSRQWIYKALKTMVFPFRNCHFKCNDHIATNGKNCYNNYNTNT